MLRLASRSDAVEQSKAMLLSSLARSRRSEVKRGKTMRDWTSDAPLIVEGAPPPPAQPLALYPPCRSSFHATKDHYDRWKAP